MSIKFECRERITPVSAIGMGQQHVGAEAK